MERDTPVFASFKRVRMRLVGGRIHMPFLACFATLHT
jgi:hypothetical protein